MSYNNEALMAAAAQMLQASGPSRTPVGLGQILGGGMSTYMGAAQAAKQRELEEQQAKQMAEMRAMQMQEMEGALSDRSVKRAAIARDMALQQKFAAGGATSQASAPLELGDTPMASTPGMPQPDAQPAKSTNPYERAMAYAKFLEREGEVDRAMAVAKEALELRPKTKEWVKVRDGDKVKYAPLYDDGTAGAPVDREVAEKLEFRDAGGTVVGLDAFTGAQKTTIGKTATIADNLAQKRYNFDREKFNFDKNKEAKPVFNADLGGFVSPPSKANPNGAIIPLAGSPTRGPKMTEDQAKATGWLVQAETAWNNMKSVAYDKEGKLTSATKPGFPDAVGALPFGIGEASANMMRGKDRQKFMQGASSMGEALLRAATGAGVNRDEAIQKQKELTPQFGDDDELIAQKMAAIPVYLETLRVRAGPGAALGAAVINKPRTAPGAVGGWSIKRKD